MDNKNNKSIKRKVTTDIPAGPRTRSATRHAARADTTSVPKVNRVQEVENTSSLCQTKSNLSSSSLTETKTTSISSETETKPILTLTSSETEPNPTTTSSNPKPITSVKDLGPGYLQYLPPHEARFIRKYNSASPEERVAMLVGKPIDETYINRANALETIFDHLPTPYKDFEPIIPNDGSEMYLEPAHRDMFLLEKTRSIGEDFLANQSFEFSDRNNLIEKLAELLKSPMWRRETFLQAVGLIDLVFSKGTVPCDHLFCYALACLQIAIKLNEQYIMAHDDLVKNHPETPSRAKMEKAEANILNFLEFDLYGVQPYQFLIRVNLLDKLNKPLLSAAKYLLEVSLFNRNLVIMLPSKVSAACYALARRITIDRVWSVAHHYYSGYNLEELEPVMRLLIQTLEDINIEHPTFVYYNTEENYFVADTVHGILCESYHGLTVEPLRIE